MKCFSLFTGVGGFEQGFPKDWEYIGFSEIDKYAVSVLKYHYPNVKNYGDCSKIDYGQVPNFDLLTGGSPCQDFSIAGKRAGIVGSRSGLVWEYIRCLREKQPRYFIWENVKGVMSSRGGWDFANILTAFSESGYSLWWQVLNAKDFGVPQNRERIFVCGFREENPPEVFFEPKDSGQIEIVGTTKGEENTRRGISSQKHPFIVAQRGRNPQNPKSRKSGLKTEQMLEPNLTGNSNTLTGVEKDNYVFDGKVRKLMPIECERLMGWEDNRTKFGIDEKGNKVEISDSQRYKMCGNGVVSNVVRAIVKNLISKSYPQKAI